MRFNITLLQLETFAAVYETGSTVSAARKLYTSQSSISKTLTRLEENLGFPLFVHHRGKTELTDAGQILADTFNALLDGLDEGIRSARLVSQTPQPTLKIAASTYLAHDLIKDYTKLYPSFYLNLSLYTEQHLKQMLTDREVDIILSTTPGAYTSSMYKWIPLMNNEVLAVLPSSHPLAHQKAVTLRSLENESFICNNIGLNADFLRQMFHHDNCSIKNLLECNDDRVFTDYLDSHERLTFLPSYALITTLRNPSIRELRIEGSAPQQQFGFVYLQDTPPSGQLSDFIQHSLKYCADLEQKANALLNSDDWNRF